MAGCGPGARGRGACGGGHAVREVASVSTRRRTLGVWSTKRPLGPNGEKLCYNCLGPLPKGRPYNCSPACSERWRCRTSPSHLRFLLKQRDHGVCVLCGIDTIALRKQYQSLCRSGWSTEENVAFAKAHGVPPGRRSTDWWDADHIVPVIEGGGETGIENFRTLCIPCHQKVTKELRCRMKQRRVEAKPLPLLEECSR